MTEYISLGIELPTRIVEQIKKRHHLTTNAEVRTFLNDFILARFDYDQPYFHHKIERVEELELNDE